MTYSAGIDLGTTFTAAAVSRSGVGRSEVVSLGDRAASLPSVVLIGADATILVGDAAARRAVLEPDRVAREFKRRLGDSTPLLLGGAPHSAESLHAKLLHSVYETIVQHEGGPPERVAVTYPANWGPYKKELLSQTLRMAGLEDAITVTEPEAAAVHYAANERVEPGEVVAVYDLGGGTFDAAVLRKTYEGFNLLGTPEGLEHLGGVDFDHSILQHVNSALGGTLDQLDLEDASARADLARLRADCAEAKEALSTDTEVTIPVSLSGTRSDVRLTRAELDEMVAPAIAETIDALKRAIDSAEVPLDQISRVLLVGGASRMPIVSRMVATELGRPVFVDAHPKHAIALGAALIADRATKVPAAVSPPVADERPRYVSENAYIGKMAASISAPAPAPAVEPNEELPAPPESPTRKRRVLVLPKRSPVTLAVLVTLVASIVGYVLVLRPQAEAAGVLYQDPVSRGPSPFTQPAVDEERADSSSSSKDEAQGPFGGSGVLTKCNKELLVKFLKAHPDRKAAWLEVLDVDAEDFTKYMDGLRSAILTVDTRVTNHGFKNGRAFSLQSILAKGTAVLVDRQGKIVTRCYCGNPLTPPVPQGSSTCEGCPRGYQPPAECKGADCYELVSNESNTRTEEDQDAGPESSGVSGRRTTQSLPSKQSEISQDRPATAYSFTGQTPDEGSSGDESTNNTSQLAPDDDEDNSVGDNSNVVGPAPGQGCSEANPCVPPG